MKTKIIKKTNLGFGFSEIFTALILATLLYGSYLYVPLVYKSQELQTIVKDYTFKTGSATPEMLKAAVMEDAKSKLNIDLNFDDVIVTMENDRTVIQATWRPVILIPLIEYRIHKTFTVSYERKQLK